MRGRRIPFMLMWLVLTAWLAGLPIGEARAGYLLVLDDRAAFAAQLTRESSSTVVDSNAAFAADPDVGTVDRVVRSGQVAGQTFVYHVYDVDFSLAPTGQIEPGVVGGDIHDLDSVRVEQPAAQGGAVGQGTWGVDSLSGSTSTPNALLVDFVQTPDDEGVGHFGVDLLDFEASEGAGAGQLRIYQDGTMVHAEPIAWDDLGNGVSHFLGVIATSPDDFFDQVAIVVGDDDGSGAGSERWAADRLTFGRATNPEPSSVCLMLGAAMLGAGGRWYRQRSAERSKRSVSGHISQPGRASGEG